MKTKIFKHEYGNQARLEIGPFAAVLDDYVAKLRKTGYPDTHFTKAFRIILRFSDWVGLKQISLKKLNQERIEEFWKYHGAIRKHCDFKVLGNFIQFLRDRDLIPKKPQMKIICPIEKQLFEFEKYLRDERGLSALYIYQQMRVARFFLKDTSPVGNINWRYYNAQVIGEYLTKLLSEKGSEEVKQASIRLMPFFKYLFIRGKTKTDLSRSVPRPANWKETKLPIYIGPDKVKKLLASCDRATQIGSRDHAILMILSRLGLRSCEIKNLNLEDLHWRESAMTVRGKGKESKMPMPKEVGESVAEYIKTFRPRTPSRSAFVSTFPPHHGFKLSTSVSGIVSFALQRAKIESSHQGGYLLRHTLANECLKSGTLEDVARLLRHEQYATSTIYAKVDLKRLSIVTKTWVGGAV